MNFFERVFMLKKLKEFTKTKIAADESIRKNLDFKFEELKEYVDKRISTYKENAQMEG